MWYVYLIIDKRSFPAQVENESSDPNDFGVSLTERIKRRKRAAQQSEAADKNNSFDESNYDSSYLFFRFGLKTVLTIILILFLVKYLYIFKHFI